MTKKILLVSTLVFLSVGLGPVAYAESESAHLNVNVLPRKITDTENDFNFGSIAYKQSQQSRVLGAQTEKVPRKSAYRQYITFVLTGNISLVLLDYYLGK